MSLFELRNYQKDIISNTITHFKCNDKAILNMCCGSGKTITSLAIAKELNSEKILILVPSLVLLNQWISNISLIFTDKKIAKYRKNITEFDILISTYHNSKNINEFIDITFDLIILDECHHLTGDLTKLRTKSFFHTFNLKKKKQLSLTATIKKINKKIDNKIDNTSIDYFGNIIAEYNIEWGVLNKVITDFEIQLLIVNTPVINSLLIKITKKDHQLCFSAYIALRYIKDSNSKNVLIYANTIKNAEEIIKNCESILKKNVINTNKIIKLHNCTSKSDFTLSDLDKNNYNILVSVYSLGEGFDLPELDTVIFAENMTSEIRIIQSMLRPCRLFPNKHKALIVLPIICQNNVATQNDFKKIRLIINSLNNHDKDIANYYFSKITASEMIKNNFAFVNYDLTTVNKFLNNIITSKNQFSIVEC